MFRKKKEASQAPEGRQSRSFLHPQGAAEGKNELKDVKKLAGITAIAVCVAVAATTYSYFVTSNATAELSEVRQATTPAVFTVADIPQGTVLSSEMLKVVDVPSPYVGAGTFTSVDDLVGKSTLYAITANSQMTSGMLSGQDNATALAATLAEGSVGYAVAVDGETGVANLIHQNDRVDVLSDGTVVLQNVRAVALDRMLTGETTSYSTVTLEVTIEQAQALQVVQQAGIGPVRLVLRPTLEQQGEGV